MNDSIASKTLDLLTSRNNK